MGKYTRAVALAAATALALGGCSMLGGDEDSGGSSETSSSASSSSGTVSGGENGAKEAGIDLENPPKPIAQATIKHVGEDVDSTKIELLELSREDNVMLATFRLTGDGRGNETKSAYDLLGSNSFEPVFIDMKNLEKYESVEDLTSDELRAQAPLGEPVYVFTAFPLPRDGVSSMDLRVTSDAPVIQDIPMPK